MQEKTFDYHGIAGKQLTIVKTQHKTVEYREMFREKQLIIVKSRRKKQLNIMESQEKTLTIVKSQPKQLNIMKFSGKNS